MSDVVFRSTTLLSEGTGSVSSSAAVQISGASTAALPAITPTFPSGLTAYFPSYHRGKLTITNNHTTAILYVGATSGVTTSTAWVLKILPGGAEDLLENGSVPRWVISDTDDTPFTIEEFA
ncbi:MAG TPA: hypothetical protein VG944_08700 [Fimbriimonas sp.]|nr:hypothetical protein [Fimbriimonas sp.]